MVQEFGLTEKQEDIGYFAGLLASSTFVGSLLSSFLWGSLSDRIGRRPILLMTQLSTLICGLLFGFSTSYRMAMFARFLDGFFSSIGVAKTSLSEITNDTNQAKGFSIIGVCWGVGLLLGPAIGGLLCLPSQKYPDVFPPNAIFDHFPFALPCLVVATVTTTGLVVSLFMLPETRPRVKSINEVELGVVDSIERFEVEKCFKENIDSPSSVLDLTDSDKMELRVGVDCKKQLDFEKEALLTGKPEEVSTTLSDELFRVDTVCSVLIYDLLGLVYVAYDELFPLWCLSRWNLGGLNLGSNEVGLAQTAGGVSLIPFQLFVEGCWHRSHKASNRHNVCPDASKRSIPVLLHICFHSYFEQRQAF
ncbi:unnamed protein product [Closterium sp. Naga37s-1]|nr:unnamed protein product [Closterium sp. Naga37s-1]